MKKNRVKKLEANISRDRTSKENTEQKKVLEQIFALNPKSADEQIEILNSLECSEKNRELIMFAIRAEEEHGNNSELNRLMAQMADKL